VFKQVTDHELSEIRYPGVSNTRNKAQHKACTIVIGTLYSLSVSASVEVISATAENDAESKTVIVGRIRVGSRQ